MKVNDWNAQDTYEQAKQYRCGYCELNVATNMGYGQKIVKKHDIYAGESKEPPRFVQHIAICPNCAKPTFWDGVQQVPGPPYGGDVKHLPPDIDSLYKEVRNCMQVAAYTSGAMACRKILMNVAVHQGAKENGTFKGYVEYLVDNGFVPPNGKSWVDHIKDKGNEANHEIPSMSQTDLSYLIMFTGGLLTFIYEFPGNMP